MEKGTADRAGTSFGNQKGGKAIFWPFDVMGNKVEELIAAIFCFGFSPRGERKG